ncbi:hypothetical protein [Roseibacillus persicicus]|uniref:hypothetical protein n=1 Tax=Roseibacillus persicicus TaxID=454148 RepID=UPI002810C213|nr:hypothetical protein [Roseibacillus persicicus]
MKISDGVTLLTIECEDLVAYDVPYTVSVSVGRNFTALCENLFFIVGPELRARFKAFERLEFEDVKVGVDEDGFIKATRKSRGGIVIDYRLSDSNIAESCAISGRIEIEGEDAGSVLGELRNILFSKVAE